MKKYLAFLLAAMMVAGLAGCSGNSAPAQNSSKQEQSSDSAEVSDTASEATQGEASAENEVPEVSKEESIEASYTPVDPDSIPVTPMSDFDTEKSSGMMWIKGYNGTATQIHFEDISNFEGIEKIVITDGFKGNDTLTYVYIPDGYSLSASAFANSKKLEEVVCYGNLFNGHAFENCPALIRAEVCSEFISEGTFTGCTNLETLVIKDRDTMTTISGIDGCTSLKNVTFPTTEFVIKSTGFAKCTSLKELDFTGTGLVELYSGVFDKCTGLTSVVLPETFKATASLYNPFTNCPSLSSLTIANENDFFTKDGVVYMKSKDREGNPMVTILCAVGEMAEKLVLDESLTIIRAGAFETNTSISEVVIPESCLSIEKNAFSNSSLTAITLPDNDLLLHMEAFYGCKNLKELNLPDSIRVTAPYFDSLLNNGTVVSYKGKNYSSTTGSSDLLTELGY